MDYNSDSTESSIDPDQPISGSVNSNAGYHDGDHSLADRLRLAASNGQIDSVKQFIVVGASFEADKDGRTVLHYAALGGFTDVVRLLIDSGCKIDACDNNGYSAVHRAAAQGHIDVVNALTEAGCYVDHQDYLHGNTALHEAAWNGYSRTLQLLVANGANVQLLNKSSFSALHLAAQNGHNESARILLYAGCNTQHKNNYGDTALHTAARYGHAGVTRILIGAHCNVNDSNKNYDTALHIAAALKRCKIAKLLLAAGVNVIVKNKQGERAIDVANRKHHMEIVDLLLAHSRNPVRVVSYDALNSDQRLKSSEASLEDSGDVKTKKKKRFFFRKKKSKEKQSDSETSDKAARGPVNAAPTVDSRLMPPPTALPVCQPVLPPAAVLPVRPSAEQLVLGFRLHHMQQQQMEHVKGARNQLNGFNRQEPVCNGGCNCHREPAAAARANQLMRSSSPIETRYRSLSPDGRLQNIQRQMRTRLAVVDDNCCYENERYYENERQSHNSCHHGNSRPYRHGPRLVRSVSDETLSSVSVLPSCQTAAATLKSRKVSTHAALQQPHDRYQRDFIVGAERVKEIDLDRVTDGQSGSGREFVEDFSRPNVDEFNGRVVDDMNRRPTMRVIPANVLDWLARNELETRGEGPGPGRLVVPGSAGFRMSTVHDL